MQSLVASTYYPEKYIRAHYDAHHKDNGRNNDSEQIQVVHRIHHGFLNRGTEIYVYEPRKNSKLKYVDDLNEYADSIGMTIDEIASIFKYTKPTQVIDGSHYYDVYIDGKNNPYTFVLCLLCDCIDFESAMDELRKEDERNTKK